MMKAQAVFEFIIASLIMFSIVIYTISYLSSSFATHHDISKNADLQSKAMRVSDMLTGGNDAGIFSEWPNLDTAKMQQLNDSCAGNDGYFNTLDRLGLNESYPTIKYNRLQILASGEDGTVYIKCGRTPVEEAASGKVMRFGYVPDDGVLANITVTVW
ncbi:MAG: hypothetical protein V1813_02535 [Candidatus Aenigmatarchaeota archaeon]